MDLALKSGDLDALKHFSRDKKNKEILRNLFENKRDIDRYDFASISFGLSKGFLKDKNNVYLFRILQDSKRSAFRSSTMLEYAKLLKKNGSPQFKEAVLAIFQNVLSHNCEKIRTKIRSLNFKEKKILCLFNEWVKSEEFEGFLKKLKCWSIFFNLGIPDVLSQKIKESYFHGLIEDAPDEYQKVDAFFNQTLVLLEVKMEEEFLDKNLIKSAVKTKKPARL